MLGRRAFGASVNALGLTNKAVFEEGEEASKDEGDGPGGNISGKEESYCGAVCDQ